MVHRRIPLPETLRRRSRIFLRLLPLLLFFSLTVGVGLVHGALQSVALTGPPAFVPDAADRGAWYAYRELFSRGDLVASLLHTVYVAGVSAAVSVSLGALGAYALWRAPRPVRRILGVYRLPIILPHLVVGFLTVLLWGRTGVVASVFHRFGLDLGPEGFPSLLYSGNGFGMIAAYVYKEFPFVMLMALGVLDRLPRRLVSTAEMLGAGPVRTFTAVVLPNLVPLLNQLGIILFLYALGGFEIPWLLGSARPQMVSMTVYALYFQGTPLDRSIAMAALSLLAIVALLFVVVYARVSRRLAAWERPV